MSEPHVPHDSPDAWVTDICQQMLARHRDIEEPTDRDARAPDYGPNHERHDALWEEFDELQDQLIRAAPPTTLERIRVLAQVSMVFVFRTCEGALRPESVGKWLRFFALTSAAGKPETIPLPPGWLAGVAGLTAGRVPPFIAAAIPDLRWYPPGIQVEC